MTIPRAHCCDRGIQVLTGWNISHLCKSLGILDHTSCFLELRVLNWKLTEIHSIVSIESCKVINHFLLLLLVLLFSFFLLLQLILLGTGCDWWSVHDFLNFLLQKLKVLPIDLDGESLQVNSQTHALLYSSCLFFNLFILCDDVLLNLEHFIPISLNGSQFIIGLCVLNVVEDLEDLVVLILHV